MNEPDVKEDPETLSAGPGDEEATDIVGPTGEEMPLAMHDQGHTTFREAAPDEAFDPRLQYSRPKTGSA